MATLVSVTRQGVQSGEFSVDDWSENWQYIVEFDTAGATPYDAAFATGIPAIGTVHSSLRMRVVSKSAEQVSASPRHFIVTVRFSAKNQRERESKPDGDDVKWNVQASIDAMETQEETRLDVNGDNVANAVGDPFSPGLTKTYYDPVLSLSYDTDVYAVSLIEGCRGSLNSDAITITLAGLVNSFAAKEMKLLSATASPVYQDGGEYWHVELKFGIRYGGWKYEVVDKGYRARPTAGADPQLTADGTIVYLAADGTALPAGDPGRTISFELESATPFSNLFDGTGLT